MDNYHLLPENHYLRIAKEENSSYWQEFLIAIKNLKELLSAKDYKKLCSEKLLFNQKVFDEKKFIQGACEVAVANYFRKKKDFKLEVHVNPDNNSDVDCQFKSKEFTYNIEVKCASYDAKEVANNTNDFKYQTWGRIENREELYSLISEEIDAGLLNNGKTLMNHVELKNMDNNLKSFLESANKKFSNTSSEQEINVLLIGCDDIYDIQNWVGYLISAKGLFTSDSFHNTQEYANVDLVLLTNLYYKHKDFKNKNIDNSWNLDCTFNIYFGNPFRLKEKYDGLTNFINHEIVNYNQELDSYIIPGNAPNIVKEARRIPHFVIDYLENQKNIFLFEKVK